MCALYCLPAAASQCVSGWKLLSHDPMRLPKPALLGTPWRDTQQTAEDLCYLTLISSILPRKLVPVLGWSPQQDLPCVIKPGEGVVGRSPFMVYIQFPPKGPWGSFGKKITSLGWLEVTQHVRRGWHLICLLLPSPVPRLILRGIQPESS